MTVPVPQYCDGVEQESERSSEPANPFKFVKLPWEHGKHLHDYYQSSRCNTSWPPPRFLSRLAPYSRATSSSASRLSSLADTTAKSLIL